MKTIENIQLPGARKLSPLEMNRIYFETGRHTPLTTPSGADPVARPQS